MVPKGGGSRTRREGTTQRMVVVTAVHGGKVNPMLFLPLEVVRWWCREEETE